MNTSTFIKRVSLGMIGVGLCAAAVVFSPVISAKSSSKQLWHSRPSTTTKAAPAITVYDFSTLVSRVKPAVFNLTISGRARGFGRSRRFRHPFDSDPWERYFRYRRRAPRRPSRSRRQPIRSRGSGFLINAKGYGLTNNHVIRNAGRIRAQLADGREFDVTVIGRSPELDLALIRLRPKGSMDFPYVYLGRSAPLKVGEPVVAIGNARGLGISVTAGIVSAKGRMIGSSRYDNYIQTDASINRGNSGGPLFNKNGEVIGINTAILRGGRGIGFAIPVDIVRRVLPQLKRYGKVRRAQLGVQIQEVKPELIKSFGLKRARGALVRSVFQNTPASRAGIRPGDVILRFNGQEVGKFSELPRLVAFNPPGSPAVVLLLRNHRKLTVKVRLSRMDGKPGIPIPIRPSVRKQPETKLGKALSRLGIGIAELTPGERRQMRLSKGKGVKIVTVLPNSAAERNQLQRGDVILEVNRVKVASPSQFAKLVGEIAPSENILLLIRRGNGSLFLAFPLP